MKAAALVIALSLIVLAEANIFRHYKSRVPDFSAREAKLREAGVQLPVTQWFTQKLDHFNHQEQRTYQQRYFTNATFFNPDLGGPIFLQVGGEGAISPLYVLELEMVNYAQQYGALMFAVEHRFYGESQPFPDLSTPNLVYLSSQQALADLSNFITQIRAQYPTATYVVTFGGSYPGNLAAWFRLKYPHLTIGSVASSAPVQATIDMFEYLDVVDESLDQITGIECDNNIRNATIEIQNMLLTSSGQAQLSTMFSTCASLVGGSPNDFATFMSDLAGNWMGVVQYNQEQPGPNITGLCLMMNNPSQTPLQNYVDVANIFLNSANPCLDASYSDMIDQLNNLTEFGSSGVGARQWTYQTCTQFGFFQTTDSPSQPFGDLIPLDYYLDICQDAFGFSFLPDVNETNAHYGGNKPSGASRIMFVNGSIDPWHSLSVTTSEFDVTAVYIEGTAHCANMFPARPTDPPGLALAQKQISAQIGQWLEAGP